MNKGVRWPLCKWNVVLRLGFDWNGSWSQWAIWNSSLFQNDILLFHISWNDILFLSAGWNSRRSISRVLTYETPISPLPSLLTGPCCICSSFSPYGPSYSQTGFQTSNFLPKLGYNIQQSLLFLSQFLISLALAVGV